MGKRGGMTMSMGWHYSMAKDGNNRYEFYVDGEFAFGNADYYSCNHTFNYLRRQIKYGESPYKTLEVIKTYDRSAKWPKNGYERITVKRYPQEEE